ncbi:MAG: ArsR/SmtB family transcription factor [Mycoplasma sp.]
MKNKELAECMKALSDETRVSILKKLKQNTQCGCDILESFKITQPTFSYHMKILVECNLVTFEKKGVCNHYCINQSKIDFIIEFFKNL